jgi:hypothetical protein
MLLFGYVGGRSHRRSVYRFENVARPDTRRFARRSRYDLDRRYTFRAGRPVDPVFDLLPL